MEKIVALLREAAAHRRVRAAGPEGELGIGFDPNPEQIRSRREGYAVGAAILTSLADFAKGGHLYLSSEEDEYGFVDGGGRFISAVALVCTATAERVADEVTRIRDSR